MLSNNITDNKKTFPIAKVNVDKYLMPVSMPESTESVAMMVMTTTTTTLSPTEVGSPPRPRR